jgi:hypothetical protein
MSTVDPERWPPEPPDDDAPLRPTVESGGIPEREAELADREREVSRREQEVARREWEWRRYGWRYGYDDWSGFWWAFVLCIAAVLVIIWAY